MKTKIENKLVHEYINNGYYILMDVNSCNNYSVDRLVYFIVKVIKDLYDNQIIDIEDINIKSNVKLKVYDTYDENKFDDCEFNLAYDEVINLINNGNLFTKELDKDYYINYLNNRKTIIKSICLNIAHSCNLMCTYCFASKGTYSEKSSLMSLDVAKKSLDFLIKNSSNIKNLEVDFFGGEPLLNFDVVKKTVEYGRKLEKIYNKHFKFTITTNGILLDDDKIHFINKEFDNVVLSCDGRKEVNDRMRYFKNKDGSYDLIVKNFKKLVKLRKDKSYYVRGTFTKYNLDFLNDIKHMVDLGFKEISIEPVIANDDVDYAIKEKDLNKIYKEYDLLTLEILRKIKDKKYFNFFHFNIDDNSPCFLKRLFGCGAGVEYVAITPSGDLYPCHQFVGNENFKIGNIDSGIQRKDIIENFKRCNVFVKDKCKDCFAKFYCSGGCMANAYNFSNSIYGNYDIGCKLQKKRLECAIMLYFAKKEIND